MIGKQNEVLNEEASNVLQEGVVLLGPSSEVNMGQKGIQNPNLPRPPNIHARDTALENEFFLDADDNASLGSMELDMELVEETPRLHQ
ncbi:hypothetical protein A2U01_0038319 [Trifolium medium]|uniref:Uncharacterized protein n=1 Tax=Trifolium medium TaxID=97028 RepID=A0A392PZT7_9FABA|nr:hypothetical protein [Trifolium medium]